MSERGRLMMVMNGGFSWLRVLADSNRMCHAGTLRAFTRSTITIGAWRPWLLLLLSTVATAQETSAPPPRFFVLGDAPYTRSDLESTRQLLGQIADTQPDFIAHVGDFKGGSAPCSEGAYRTIRDLFGAQTPPLVFSPGDNDWTDCRRDAAGAHDPVERLALLRRLFFDDDAVLRLSRLPELETAASQGYPELLGFRIGHTRFVSLHVVGSANNRITGEPGAMAEWRRRSEANRQWLTQQVEKADFDSLVILFHANPGFHRRNPHPAYAPLLSRLRAIGERLDHPILLVHGDSHDFTFDQPYADRPRLWRLEVPGYPFVAGVMVEVTRSAAEPFRIDHVQTEHEMMAD